MSFEKDTKGGGKRVRQLLTVIERKELVRALLARLLPAAPPTAAAVRVLTLRIAPQDALYGPKNIGVCERHAAKVFSSM